MNVEWQHPSCYSRDRKPQRVPESSQVAEWHKRKNGVRDQYGSVANEREKRK